MRFKFVIDAQVPVHLSGNCMALLDYRAAKRGDEAMMDKYAFAGLFEGQNIGSVTRDFLPAKNLMESCYLAMFKDCINLMIPPDLPAKQMAADCYESMFERCTSLQTLPKFNFTNPERFCFHNMFERAVYYLNPNNIPQELLEENLYCKDMFLNAIDKGGAIQ